MNVDTTQARVCDLQSSLALITQFRCVAFAPRSLISWFKTTAVRQMAEITGLPPAAVTKTQTAAATVVSAVIWASLSARSLSQRAIFVARHGEKPLKDSSMKDTANSSVSV